VTAMTVEGAGRRRDPGNYRAAAGMTHVHTGVKDRASTPRDNATAIDRWEDEGGAGESPTKGSATPLPIPRSARR
jgi:hypothetical protein